MKDLLPQPAPKEEETKTPPPAQPQKPATPNTTQK